MSSAPLLTGEAIQDYSSSLLKWFIEDVRAPMKMEERAVGPHRYFLCISSVEQKGRQVPVCGRGTTKLEAAIRCIGEYAERCAAFDFFADGPRSVAALQLTEELNQVQFSLNTHDVGLLPPDLWTTNGWAVHTNLEAAVQSAIDEALERHLLLASFLRWGSQGLIEIGQIEVGEFQFRSCLSRFQTVSRRAGFAIGSRGGAPGQSFGHFCDSTMKINQSSKWRQALYESVDKFSTQFDASKASDPIAHEVDWYLRNAVELETAAANTQAEDLSFGSANLHVIDLTEKWGLPFPLSAVYVFGGSLLPLFVPNRVGSESRRLIQNLCQALGFDAVWPERIPVL